MPQDHRKVAFSSKKKKLQLQQKRARKNADASDTGRHLESSEILPSSSKSVEQAHYNVKVINQQPATGTKYNPNRFNLVFKKEDNTKIKEKIAVSYETLTMVPKEELEVSYEDIFKPGSELDIPKRPPWNPSYSKHVLEANEQKYFREYVTTLEREFGDALSYFDLNLETWRQLWRVLEFSDIVLLVLDIRHPVFHFSPALYNYITKDLQKDMIVVFNKIDLVEPAAVVSWTKYFKANFPELHIMYFASYAGMKVSTGKKGKRIGKLHMAIEGSLRLLKVCESIVKGKVDLSSWHKKIELETKEVNELPTSMDEDFSALKNASVITSTADTSCYQGDRYKDGSLTIGFVGHPNVGKSSFLNAVIGKKVVSVSRTPGHTKHYQTIQLTENVRLCDCPGLIFPSLLPKQMQVLMGCYPIAQVREPYSAVQYLAERLPVHQILNLQHSEYDPKKPDEKPEWSAYEICAAFAQKRGFLIARTARPDAYRGANNILRMAVDGRTICLTFYPPSFFKNSEQWKHHPEFAEVMKVQAHRSSEIDIEAAQLSDSDSATNHSESGNSNHHSESEDSDPPVASNKFGLLSDMS